ncbi:sugar transporter [Psychrobacter sp. FDAARGOS_221]|uniref:sugar transporter n=1 Tax=Psychrobacter sp. FDAARGOS_221 TaxID=1975705 RepID=UPI001D0D1157|nr:sugar transporter [Psychrobacter sp. FDAARGOS_221]
MTDQTQMPDSTPDTPEISRRSQYIQVMLMGVSAFVMNTTEFVPVALLSDIAQDFAITTAQTGWMLTIYAWIVAAMSLPLMLLTRNFERKRLLLGIFALFIVSHILSYFAWSFNVLLISRVGIAFAHAIFWSITAAIAIRVAPKGKKALALSVVATGTSMAMVLGVPIGRLIGQWFGWRTTFAGIGMVALLVCLLQAKLLPTLPSMFKGSFNKVPELLKNPVLIGLYLLCFIVFSAHYTAYSYIEPFMSEIGAISENYATWVLLLFGGAGVIGSIIFGRWGDRHDTSLMIGSTIIMLVSMLTLLASVHSVTVLSINALFWGTALMLLIISIQGKVLAIDVHAQDMLMSMFSGIINLGIGTGAFVGGYAVTHLSLSSIGFVGAAFVSFAILLVLVMRKALVHRY